MYRQLKQKCSDQLEGHAKEDSNNNEDTQPCDPTKDCNVSNMDEAREAKAKVVQSMDAMQYNYM